MQITVKNLLIKAIKTKVNNRRLLDILLEHTDILHACGAKGRCTTCKVRIVSGMSSLNDPTAHEEIFIQRGLLAKGDRMSCQITPKKDLVIEIPEECKLPHLNYVY